MTTAIVSGLSQSPQLVSSKHKDSQRTKSDSVVTSSKTAVQPAATVLHDSKASATDTVSISDLSRRAVAAATKPLTADEETKKKRNEPAAPQNFTDTQGTTVAKVEFTYDSKGERIVRYLDTADRLVYQQPSELTLQLNEHSKKTADLLNTRV